MRKNAVLLDGLIVGVYNNEELDSMLVSLANYYGVKRNEFEIKDASEISIA
ncbi:hypothetical protein ACU3L3_07220 [Priestia endophytica]